MGEIKDYSDCRHSSDQQVGTRIMPKDEPHDFDVPSETTYPRHAEENVASSSGSNIRSSFIGMGFSQALVDKVISEKGEDNSDLLLETLCAYSALQEQNSESSFSLSELSSDSKDENNPPEFEAESHAKQEPGVYDKCNKRSSLLMMNFSVAEIEFSMDKLGGNASVADLVDFIVAAQIAGNPGKDGDNPTQGHGEKNEDDNTEALSGTMGKTLRLLEMGFSDREISLAIEKFGSELPISELADAIFAGQIFDTCTEEDKYSAYAGSDNRSLGIGVAAGLKRSSDTNRVKSEKYGLDDASKFRCMEEKIRKGKRRKQENMDESNTLLGSTCLEDTKPDLSRYWTTPKRDLQRVGEALNEFGMASLSKTNPCSSSVTLVAKPPYFFYGNVEDIPQASWTKMSHFLYGLEPEFVNTQLYSALNRKEGYIHNLPTENRFHIFPRPPMTIKAAIPHTKEWWPSWDSRKQLSCISSETTGISQLCDRLGRIVSDSRGLVSVEQQKDILHHCRKWNLLWVGQHKLAPTEPEHLERVLGYPLRHSLDAAISMMERLHSLEHCFQTDTLGYHLSVLKPIFPAGLRVLSLYSGIGGVEIALHRLDIHLRSVVSVETSEAKRRILQKWWHDTAQTGELVQIEDIQRLGTVKLESLIKRFGGFDLVICQSPSNFSSRSPKAVANGDSFAGFDFSMFCEFVRVLQNVRSIMGRKR